MSGIRRELVDRSARLRVDRQSIGPGVVDDHPRPSSRGSKEQNTSARCYRCYPVDGRGELSRSRLVRASGRDGGRYGVADLAQQGDGACAEQLLIAQGVTVRRPRPEARKPEVRHREISRDRLGPILEQTGGETSGDVGKGVIRPCTRDSGGGCYRITRDQAESSAAIRHR